MFWARYTIYVLESWMDIFGIIQAILNEMLNMEFFFTSGFFWFFFFPLIFSVP